MWCLVVCWIGGCTKHSPENVLHVWHFWSEPNQERVFQALIRRFEEAHPDVRVELTALQWSEGKAKLRAGLGSSSPPDIIQLGAEWIAEFSPALQVLDSALASTLSPEFRHIGIVGGARLAVPWTVNARVLFVHHSLAVGDTTPWEDYVRQLEHFHHPPVRYGIGLCTSDPHNVLKRELPLLWACGAKLWQSLPLVATALDTTLSSALSQLRRLARAGIIEPSRQLDERLRRGQVGAVLSGVWMLADSAVVAQYNVLSRIPGVAGSDGASILSGDCFAVVRHSAHQRYAQRLLQYLMRWEVSAAFCRQVPDAGFPAVQSPTPAALDSLLNRSPQWWQAYRQTLRSRLLPTPAYFLDAEDVTEELLTALLYERITPAQMQAQLIERLEQIERRHHQSN